MLVKHILRRGNEAIHAFKKSMNDVICGKIIHVAKMATKNESSVDFDFAVCSTYIPYIKRNIFFIQCTPYSCGVYHIWFNSNQIPVQLYLILDLRDKVWLVYRAFTHRSRGGCTFSKATDHYSKTIQYNIPEIIIPEMKLKEQTIVCFCTLQKSNILEMNIAVRIRTHTHKD